MWQIYYSDFKKLLEHAHTVQWNGYDRRNISTKKVLQFIQLSQKSRREWLFIGAFSLSGEEYKNVDGNTIADFEVIPEFESFEGRLIASYSIRQGVSGAGALTHNLSKESVRKDYIKKCLWSVLLKV